MHKKLTTGLVEDPKHQATPIVCAQVQSASHVGAALAGSSDQLQQHQQA